MTERDGGSGGWHLPVAWTAAVGCGTALLLVAGRGGLATPALTDVGGWSTWLDATDPTIAVVALLRLGGLALCWYLVGVTGVALLARVLRLARLARLADLLAVGPARPIVRHVVGAALAVGVVAGSSGGYVVAAPRPAVAADVAAPGGGAGTASEPGAATATMRRLDQGDRERPTRAPLPATDVPVPAPAARVDARPPTAPGPSRTAEPDEPARAGGASSGRRTTGGAAADQQPGAASATPAPPGAADAGGGGVDVRRVVEVAPGDHLWGLAAADVEQALGRPPRDAEVVDHFAAVVEANVDRLVVGGNPDLLVPGQRVVLPAFGGGG